MEKARRRHHYWDETTGKMRVTIKDPTGGNGVTVMEGEAFGKKQVADIARRALSFNMGDAGSMVIEATLNPILAGDGLKILTKGGEGMPATAKRGRYLVFPKESIEDENGNVSGDAERLTSHVVWKIKFNPLDAIVLATESTQLEGGSAAVSLVSMEYGGQVYDGWTIEFERGRNARLMTLQDLIDAIISDAELACAFGLAGEEERGEEIPKVTLAQFSTTESFANHSLAMKTLEGMVSIAFGKESSGSYELSPKKGKGGETYNLTANTQECAEFFAKDGGNVQIMGRILETVHAMIKDGRAADFTYKGRVWFTVTKILEETLRTQGGTVQGRKNVNRKMVDDALLAASGARIKGTGPDGKTLNVEYFVNAIRRDVVMFNGAEYRDVWGFDIKGETVNDYANELGHTWNYPLLPIDKPLTVTQAGVERYLRDKMHEARARLYTSNGNISRTKSYKQTLSWPRIFKEFQPLPPMDSRQKKRLVTEFQNVLITLAGMDARDKLHPGRPLYINAYSERNAARGRGAGEWENLVIEYSSKFHVPKVNLL